MLARLKLSSAHAVAAFVVATALQFETAVIATGDPDDIRRLAAPFARIGRSPSEGWAALDKVSGPNSVGRNETPRGYRDW